MLPYFGKSLAIVTDDCSNSGFRVIMSAMRIEFFDDPLQESRSRGEVRFNQLGLYVFEDRQRIAVGFDITPFRDRPSIDVSIVSEVAVQEASLSIIEAMQTNFNLTMHLREPILDHQYEIQAILYYRTDDGDRVVVDRMSRLFDLNKVGEQ